MLTTQDLENMYNNPEWEGFGYLGERATELTLGDDPEGRTAAEAQALVAQADAMALAQANLYGLTVDQLFSWANSRNGRFFADSMFGGNGTHARSYLPTEFGHRYGA